MSLIISTYRSRMIHCRFALSIIYKKEENVTDILML